MTPAVTRTASVLRRLAGAAPDTWRDDAVFRWASIGAAISCITLLASALGGGVGKSVPPPLPDAVAPATAPSPAPGRSSSGLVGGTLPTSALPPANSGNPVTPSSGALARVPRIAPGRSLDSTIVLPSASDADRFGAVQQRR